VRHDALVRNDEPKAKKPRYRGGPLFSENWMSWIQPGKEWRSCCSFRPYIPYRVFLSNVQFCGQPLLAASSVARILDRLRNGFQQAFCRFAGIILRRTPYDTPKSPRCLQAMAFYGDELRRQGTRISRLFQGKLAEGWTWLREHREAWRTTDHGLEGQIEPGNMWGPANNAKSSFAAGALHLGSVIGESGNVETITRISNEQADLVLVLR